MSLARRWASRIERPMAAPSSRGDGVADLPCDLVLGARPGVPPSHVRLELPDTVGSADAPLTRLRSRCPPGVGIGLLLCLFPAGRWWRRCAPPAASGRTMTVSARPIG